MGLKVVNSRHPHRATVHRRTRHINSRRTLFLFAAPFDWPRRNSTPRLPSASQFCSNQRGETRSWRHISVVSTGACLRSPVPPTQSRGHKKPMRAAAYHQRLTVTVKQTIQGGRKIQQAAHISLTSKCEQIIRFNRKQCGKCALLAHQ